jgi:thiol-disulfide isomerase/thioredoxin
MTTRLTGLLRVLRLIFLFTVAAVYCSPAAADAPLWIDHDAAGERRVHLYFFWTRSCPHCQAAIPFVEALSARYPWLLVHSSDISSDAGSGQGVCRHGGGSESRSE